MTRKRKAETSGDELKQRCNFILENGRQCGMCFNTYYQLKKHKDSLGHKKQRK